MEKAMKIHENEALKLTAAQLVAIAGVSVGYMVGGGGGEGLPDFESVKGEKTNYVKDEQEKE